jgi:hypothetical protein
MKQYLVLIVLVLGMSFHNLAAQSLRQHSYEEILPGYLIFDIGINGWQGQQQESVQVQMPSFGVSLAYVAQIKLSEHWELLPGVGFSFEDYRFKDLRTIRKEDGQLVFPIIDNGLAVRKTKLALDFLEVPLELHYRTPIKGREFRIGIGAKIGYQIGARSKIKYKDAPKERISDDFYTNPFRYGLQARVGYANFSFFAYYRLNPLFRIENLDCQCNINTFNLGMSLLVF